MHFIQTLIATFWQTEDDYPSSSDFKNNFLMSNVGCEFKSCYLQLFIVLLIAASQTNYLSQLWLLLNREKLWRNLWKHSNAIIYLRLLGFEPRLILILSCIYRRICYAIIQVWVIFFHLSIYNYKRQLHNLGKKNLEWMKMWKYK